jgi:3-hydroxyisobutyrate dehydrogenase-like beta-hydroxyacid dehydrogenase
MRLALLGLGQMGSAIAERLLPTDNELWVWNRSPAAARPLIAAGALGLQDPTGAFEVAELAITMLADDAAVEAVVLESGLLSRAGDSVLVDMSTISVRSSARVAAACREHGCAFLRAPVSGNPSVVRAGRLSIVVSGPRAQFEASHAVLRSIGPNVFYVGAADQARIVKLALNLMVAGTAELIAEALVLSERHGIARADMLEVMGASAIGSPFVAYKTQALLDDDYSTTFSTKLMDKDLSLVREAADEVDLPIPLAALTQQLVRDAIVKGMGEDDFISLVPRLRREAGLSD